jgi:hypothetical protein
MLFQSNRNSNIFVECQHWKKLRRQPMVPVPPFIRTEYYSLFQSYPIAALVIVAVKFSCLQQISGKNPSLVVNCLIQRLLMTHHDSKA